LVVCLGAFLPRMNYSTAVALFLVYAASLGIVLSSVLIVYQISSVYLTFGITAGMFGGMALYGYLTKADLTSLGSLAGMALWGLILGFLLNMYFQNQMVDYLLSGVGVIIFTGLVAFDTQKIKQLGMQMVAHDDSMKKIAIMGALTLYLDFVNLFLMLLRFFGKQKD